MTHKQWLDNEYNQWVKALSECTVNNFKEHPMVRRMLSLDISHDPWVDYIEPYTDEQIKMIRKINQIGYVNFIKVEGFWRHLYYAQQIIKLNPSSVCEIGGGVGQFYAILRALGYKGEHYIYDLPDVQSFQKKYLREVSKQTGLNLELGICSCDIIVSFYALGEFDDDTKQHYSNIISNIPHGYIAWNPHSGATDDLSIFNAHKITITPGIEPGIKIIQW